MNEPTPPLPETIDPAPATPLTIANPGRENRNQAEGLGGEPSPPQGGTVAFSVDNDAVAEVLPAIPGYEILGVLGRGGMGVVYKAREIALERLVALKVVTAGRLASAEQMARFRGEARAEARLQHPNIVQVHAVGEHEGFPYLSLEYMDGGSLAQKIAGQPQSPPQAAQLVYLLARAMAYAHQRGIIHRDLKPANVLLKEDITTENTENTEQNKDKKTKEPSEHQEKREKGENQPSSLSPFREFRVFRGGSLFPKIADFGLAKSLEEESGHTRTGSLMGTPSYMSPEQADGRKDIGPAADIWALGVILYELLVGRTPFSGVTMIETLEQVRTREPVPPTQLQPKVPIDLETICLKCLRKEQSQRYITAEALADDLRRFLDGEPIHARPIGTLSRLVRWGRRNPRVAGLSAAVLLLLMTVAIVSTAFVFVLDARRREIESAWKQARTNEEIARRHEQRADHEAHEALARYQLLHEALVVVIDKVQRDLKAVPSTAKARRDILDAAIKVLQKSVAQGQDSSRHPERSLASAHMIMGHILQEQNKHKEALEHFNQAHALLETLYRANPDSDKAAGNYAVSLHVKADLALRNGNNFVEAEKLYRQALALQEKSLAQRPKQPELTETEIRRNIAISHQLLGEILFRLHPRDLTEGRQHLEEARAILEEVIPIEDSLDNRVRMEQVCYRLGEMCDRLDRPADARSAYERCLQERKKLAADYPADMHRQMEMLRMYGKIGDLYLFAGDTQTARRYYTEAIAANEALARRDRTPGPRMLLSLNYYRLGTAYLRLRERKIADDFYRKCLDLREALLKQYPNELVLQIDVMIAQGRCGLHSEAADMAGQLRERFPRDTAKLVLAACGYALASYGVAGDKAEDALTAEEHRLRQDYCARAVEALRQAKKAGYNDVKNLQNEPDLDPVRSDKNFQELIREYVAATKRPK
ncbi:MAG TPA: serine/threonine-protein kinase [Gemmataceae bacterium]|nr:serine/threonine-protein kinase [Gemmataceae bacterium]